MNATKRVRLYAVAICMTMCAGGLYAAGGGGGAYFGYQTSTYPLLSDNYPSAIMSFTGFGGIATGSNRPEGARGFFAISEEITHEIGIPLVEWFMPTVYAGYQTIGNVIPGQLFKTFFSYTPVVGIRVQWGDFN